MMYCIKNVTQTSLQFGSRSFTVLIMKESLFSEAESEIFFTIRKDRPTWIEKIMVIVSLVILLLLFA